MQRTDCQIIDVPPSFSATIFQEALQAASDESSASAFKGDEAAKDFIEGDGFNSPAGLSLLCGVEGINAVREKSHVLVIPRLDGKHFGWEATSGRASLMQRLFD